VKIGIQKRCLGTGFRRYHGLHPEIYWCSRMPGAAWSLVTADGTAPFSGLLLYLVGLALKGIALEIEQETGVGR